MIAVGVNTKMSRARCLQIIDEVKGAVCCKLKGKN